MIEICRPSESILLNSHFWNVPKTSKASIKKRYSTPSFVDLCRFSILLRMNSVESVVKPWLLSYSSGNRLWCFSEKHLKHSIYLRVFLLRCSNCSLSSYLSILSSSLISTSRLSRFYILLFFSLKILTPDYFSTSCIKSNIWLSLFFTLSPYLPCNCFAFSSRASFKIF